MPGEGFGYCQGLGPGWRATHEPKTASWHIVRECPGIIVTRLPPGAPGAGMQAGGYCGHSGLGA